MDMSAGMYLRKTGTAALAGIIRYPESSSAVAAVPEKLVNLFQILFSLPCLVLALCLCKHILIAGFIKRCLVGFDGGLDIGRSKSAVFKRETIGFIYILAGGELRFYRCLVETICLLSKLNAKQHIEVELNMDELDLTSAESKATYDEIKAYVLEKHGLKVSSLYISQVKRKCGLDVGQNYNLSKKEDAKVPQCPPEKEKAIQDALEYFKMI